MENHHFGWEDSLSSWAMFNSKLLVYQKVNHGSCISVFKESEYVDLHVLYNHVSQPKLIFKTHLGIYVKPTVEFVGDVLS